MKLIKLLYNFDTPLNEDVKSFFPRDLEETLKSEFILVSDAKFRLLQFAKVGMHVYKEFTETAAHNMNALFGLREDYITVKEIIKPSEFKVDEFDPSEYDLGDFIFIYADGPVKPEEPKKPNFHSGLFNYELSEAQKKILIDKYNTEYEAYETALEEYKTELKEFMDTEADLPVFGCLGVITKPETKIPGTVLKAYGDKKLLILLDANFETTKDVEQFGEFGKIPKGCPTLVGTDVGGLKAGESLAGKSFVEILTKVFGLEKEADPVSTIQPDESSAKGMSKPTIDYGTDASGNPKTSLGGPTESATITTTLKLPEDTKATTINLINSETGEVVESKSISSPDEEVSFTVTGLETTTIFNIQAVHEETDPESGETKTVIDGKTTARVSVIIKPATIKSVVYTTSVGSTTEPVEFTVTVVPGTSEVTSVKVVDDNGNEVALTSTEENVYTGSYTEGITVNPTKLTVVVTDGNNKVTTKEVSVALNIETIQIELTATPIETLGESSTITVTATKGTIAKITLNDGTEKTSAPWEFTVTPTITTTYTVTATDVNETTATKSISIAVPEGEPTVTATIATREKSNPSVTVNATVNPNGCTIDKVELYSSTTKVGVMTLVDSVYTYTDTINETKKYKVRVYYNNKSTPVISSELTAEYEAVQAQIYMGDYNEYYSIQPDYDYDGDEGLTNDMIIDAASEYFLAHAEKRIDASKSYTTKTDENTYEMKITRPKVTGTWAVAFPNTIDLRVYETAFNMDATDSTLTVRGTYTAPDGITYKIYASKNYTDTDSRDLFYIITR